MTSRDAKHEAARNRAHALSQAMLRQARADAPALEAATPLDWAIVRDELLGAATPPEPADVLRLVRATDIAAGWRNVVSYRPKRAACVVARLRNDTFDIVDVLGQPSLPPELMRVAAAGRPRGIIRVRVSGNDLVVAILDSMTTDHSDLRLLWWASNATADYAGEMRFSPGRRYINTREVAISGVASFHVVGAIADTM